MTVVPGPAAGPFRMARRLRGDLPGGLARLQQEYGSITRLRLPFVGTAYLVSDPDVMQEALTLTGRAYMKGVVRRGGDPAQQGLNPLTELLGEGLLTSSGQLHRRQRRLMQPLFHRERIAGYATAFAELSDAAADRWTGGAVLDVPAEMTELTLAIIARTVFDVALDGAEVATIRRVLHSDLNRPGVRPPWLNRLPLPSTRRRQAAVAELDQVVMTLIEQRKALGAGGSDLLSLLLQTRDAGTGEPMEVRQVRDEALTILLAGHETTANALAWAFHLLAHHPQQQEQVQAELDDVLGGRRPEFGDIPRLTRTAAVFSETMRLYPPAWLMVRHLVGPRTVCGHDLPAGSLLILSPFVLHRDPRLWPEPGRFDPDRWLGEQDRHRFAYVPFGAGPRQCIGYSFAELEGVIALAAIARRWTVAPADGPPVRYRAGITLQPRELRLRVSPRS